MMEITARLVACPGTPQSVATSTRWCSVHPHREHSCGSDARVVSQAVESVRRLVRSSWMFSELADKGTGLNTETTHWLREAVPTAGQRLSRDL